MAGFDLARVKRQSRQALHRVMAVLAVYEDALTEPTDVKIRWHNKLARNGAGEAGFTTEIIEGIDRLVFQQSDLAARGITLRHAGTVTLIQDGMTVVFTLEAREPQDGPENVYWSVSAE